jgi:hypothetical protein
MSYLKKTELDKLREQLHFAKKNEQKVWGSGSEHEKARAEVERLEDLILEMESV